MEEQRSPKPPVGGSSPPTPASQCQSGGTASPKESLLTQIAQLSPTERDAFLSLTHSNKASFLDSPVDGIEDWKSYMVARDLAEKAGIPSTELRKLLRKEFNRLGKTKVEGNRMEYRFIPNDPMVKQIVDRAKAVVTEKATEEEAEAEKAKEEEDC